MINISSIGSIRWTGFCYPAYAAAKAAVNQLTQSLALQYADTGVRINAILAGLIDTPLAYRELSEGHDLESVRADRAAKSPTRAMGSAQDVANAALFLASAESAYITGTMLPGRRRPARASHLTPGSSKNSSSPDRDLHTYLPGESTAPNFNCR